MAMEPQCTCKAPVKTALRKTGRGKGNWGREITPAREKNFEPKYYYSNASANSLAKLRHWLGFHFAEIIFSFNFA